MGGDLINSADINLILPSGEPDPGVLVFPDKVLDNVLPQFIKAIGAHRHFERETDLPRF